MTKKSRTYGWAVVNRNGSLMRESNDRRAIYRTREKARAAAKDLGGRVVRREQVVTRTARVTKTAESTIATMASSAEVTCLNKG